MCSQSFVAIQTTKVVCFFNSLRLSPGRGELEPGPPRAQVEPELRTEKEGVYSQLPLLRGRVQNNVVLITFSSSRILIPGYNHWFKESVLSILSVLVYSDYHQPTAAAGKKTWSVGSPTAFSHVWLLCVSVVSHILFALWWCGSRGRGVSLGGTPGVRLPCPGCFYCFMGLIYPYTCFHRRDVSCECVTFCLVPSTMLLFRIKHGTVSEFGSRPRPRTAVRALCCSQPSAACSYLFISIIIKARLFLWLGGKRLI